MRRSLALLALLAALAPGTAAGQWEQPSTLSAPDDWSDAVAAAINSRGDAIVVWRRSTRGERRSGIEGSFLPAGANEFSALRPLNPEGGSDEADIGIDERGIGHLAWQTGSLMWARTLAPDGSMSDPVQISSSFIGGPSRPVIGVDSAGNETVVWKASYQEDEYNLRTNVYYSQRAAGGDWSPEARIDYDRATVSFYDVAVADETGDAVITFDGPQGRVYASVRNGPTGDFAPPVQINSPIECNVFPDVALGANGHAAITWLECDPYQQSALLKAAVRPPGGAFGAPETVATITPHETRLPKAAVSPSGEVSVIDTGALTEQEAPLRVWTRASNGAWGAGQGVSSRYGRDFAIAYDDAGNLYATWRRYDSEYVGRALVTARPRGGSFPPEAKTISRTDLNVWSPAIAADGDGKAVATWSLGYFPVWMNVQAAMFRPPGDSAAAGAMLRPSRSSLAASRRKVRARASPRVARRRTRIRIRFTSRARLGRYDHRRRTYGLMLRVAAGTACIRNPYVQVGRARRGTHLTVAVDPRRFKGGRWCRGRYRGRIYYQDDYACPARGRCEIPEGFERLSRLVGRFRFRVR